MTKVKKDKKEENWGRDETGDNASERDEIKNVREVVFMTMPVPMQVSVTSEGRVIICVFVVVISIRASIHISMSCRRMFMYVRELCSVFYNRI